jgi:hypothetical protein
MSVDLTKLVFHSNYNAFKNNREYTGTLTISGTTSGGVNLKEFTVELDTAPDLLDISFQGNSDPVFDPFDPRPDDGWFKQGAVYVPTNNAGGGNPSKWTITTSLSGTTLTISATYIQQFTTAETLTSTNFSYKIVDYSVF